MELPYSTTATVSAPRRKLSSFSIPKFSSIHDYSYRRGTSLNSSRIKGIDYLLTRSRFTNLGIFLLSIVAIFSLLININLVLSGKSIGGSKVPKSIRATLQSPHSNLKNLVMVPGHSVWKGHDPALKEQDSQWVLDQKQKGGSVKTFIKHIKKGIEITVGDPLALLIFSGGQTRSQTYMTEATSYARLAKESGFYEKGSEEVAFHRVTTEDYALDSFENVLFSIARFKEFTGHFPSYITVVGFGMKRERYETVHRESLRWPLTSFNYIGIDNEGDTKLDYEGERLHGLEPCIKDQYGCHGNLISKRKNRNPFRRFPPYHTSVPELSTLFEYCPVENEVFDGSLPWA